jgi:hypothetical protein
MERLAASGGSMMLKGEEDADAQDQPDDGYDEEHASERSLIILLLLRPKDVVGPKADVLVLFLDAAQLGHGARSVARPGSKNQPHPA